MLAVTRDGGQQIGGRSVTEVRTSPVVGARKCAWALGFDRQGSGVGHLRSNLTRGTASVKGECGILPQQQMPT